MLKTRAGPICGVDEAGRGPLAGPVVAAAVILDRKRIPKGLDDSKQLSEEAREDAFSAHHGDGGGGRRRRSQRRRDRPGQYPPGHASGDGARGARAGAWRPAFALVDGNDAPALPCRCDTLVGRRRAARVSIAAASIIAKVTRDRHDGGAARRTSRLWLAHQQGLRHRRASAARSAPPSAPTRRITAAASPRVHNILYGDKHVELNRGLNS